MIRTIIVLGLAAVSAIVLIVGITALLDGRYLLSIACALYASIALVIAEAFAKAVFNG